MHKGPSKFPAKLKRREFLKMGAAAMSLLEQLPVEYKQDLYRNSTFFTDGPGYWDFDLDEERGF